MTVCLAHSSGASRTSIPVFGCEGSSALLCDWQATDLRLSTIKSDFRRSDCTQTHTEPCSTLHINVCKTNFMQRAKNRNLTVRLPSQLLRRVKAESATQGMSMNAYIERALVKDLAGSQDDTQRQAAEQLFAWAKDGLYDMAQPLSREEAHDRHA